LAQARPAWSPTASSLRSSLLFEIRIRAATKIGQAIRLINGG
jgi:hypothetical protein